MKETFLESCDFSGKTIHPFCTHEGSGMGGERDIQKACPGAKVMTGLAIRGSRSDKSDNELKGWLEYSHAR